MAYGMKYSKIFDPQLQVLSIMSIVRTLVLAHFRESWPVELRRRLGPLLCPAQYHNGSLNRILPPGIRGTRKGKLSSFMGAVKSCLSLLDIAGTAENANAEIENIRSPSSNP